VLSVWLLSRLELREGEADAEEGREAGWSRRRWREGDEITEAAVVERSAPFSSSLFPEVST